MPADQAEPRHVRPTHAITLDTPGNLIAAIPHMLGFYPADSLVAVGMDRGETPTAGLVMRVDLPCPAERLTDLAELVTELHNASAAAVALVVVGARGDTPDGHLPHRDLIAACEKSLSDSEIPIVHQVWTPVIAAGAQWRCYENADCSGHVPDPTSTALAAASAASGLVTYDRREELTARLNPVDDDTLARRADLLAAFSRNAEPGGGDPALRLRLVDQAVDGAVEGVLPETDEDIAALAFALSDHAIRDACMSYSDPKRALAAEELWIALVRGTPAPERAEPACLLAFCAYLRGDGTQAGIALEQAESADPGHRLADLARNALWTGLPPQRMHKVAATATAHARRAVAEHSATTSPSTTDGHHPGASHSTQSAPGAARPRP